MAITVLGTTETMLQNFYGNRNRSKSEGPSNDNRFFFNQQIGYPCPDSMELTPAGNNAYSVNGMTAECRCPPGTAQDNESTQCFKLFEQGPCELGQYFAPVIEPSNRAMMLLVCLL